MSVTLAIDFGSTYTKLVALDLDAEELIGVVQAPTTVAEDITLGLDRALDLLEASAGVKRRDIGERLACSSAAGGLRMVAIGLVPDLTAEAARRAALGAGAKVLRGFAYELSRRDLDELVAINPDMILLAGGTDGGDRKTILRNARALVESWLRVPVVVAGNRSAQEEVEAVLRGAGWEVSAVENVLPELGRLNVLPARSAIRQVFMERIIRAKGLDRAQAFVGKVLMPTPMAVLEGARMLAEGTSGEPGLGELIVVDVGGATTDVHSIASGQPAVSGMLPRGLPEPYAKRTVEGDLGIRVNAATILETAGVDRVWAALAHSMTAEAIQASVRRLSARVDRVPAETWEHELDAALARLAVEIAMERHAGRVETVYTPTGPVQILRGKDLSSIRTVIGTGGVFAYGKHSRRILEGVRFDAADPIVLRPQNPQLCVDSRYLLFAVGLLAPLAPASAVRVMKRYVVPTT